MWKSPFSGHEYDFDNVSLKVTLCKISKVYPDRYYIDQLDVAYSECLDWEDVSELDRPLVKEGVKCAIVTGLIDRKGGSRVRTYFIEFEGSTITKAGPDGPIPIAKPVDFGTGM